VIKIYTPKSSSVSCVVYDHATLTLKITYVHTKTYVYTNVPARVFDELKSVLYSDGSIGHYINTQVKPLYQCLDADIASVIQFPTSLARKTKIVQDRMARNKQVIDSYNLKPRKPNK
jgi:hypothetical protein